jgi:hypothetical protein
MLLKYKNDSVDSTESSKEEIHASPHLIFRENVFHIPLQGFTM